MWGLYFEKPLAYGYQRVAGTPGVNTWASAATSSTVQVITTTSARGSALVGAGAGSTGAGAGARPSGNAIGTRAAAKRRSASSAASLSERKRSSPRDKR